MTLLLALACMGALPNGPEVATEATESRTAASESSGDCADAAPSLSYGQIMDSVGDWVPYSDGEPIYCVPLADGQAVCQVAVRIPRSSQRFTSEFRLLVDGVEAGSAGVTAAFADDAGDDCYGASPGAVVGIHDTGLVESLVGGRATFEADVSEVSVSEDGDTTVVPDGVTYHVAVEGIVASEYDSGA